MIQKCKKVKGFSGGNVKKYCFEISDHSMISFFVVFLYPLIKI